MLSFGGASSAHGDTFRTSNDTLDLIFGPRQNELRPMWQTGVPDEQGSGSTASGSFASHLGPSGSSTFGDQRDYETRETTTDAMDYGPDGFDLDEVFGAGGGGLAGDEEGQADSQATVSSVGTARTITGRLKRAYEDDDVVSGGHTGADEEEMDATDIEDEGGDGVPRMSAWGAPPGRKLAGRRGLSKTQSLPAHVFAGDAPF